MSSLRAFLVCTDYARELTCSAVSRPKPVKDLWLATHLRNECSAAFSREVRAATVKCSCQAWDKAQFDAVICPVITVPALEHGRTTLLAPVA